MHVCMCACKVYCHTSPRCTSYINALPAHTTSHETPSECLCIMAADSVNARGGVKTISCRFDFHLVLNFHFILSLASLSLVFLSISLYHFKRHLHHLFPSWACFHSVLHRSSLSLPRSLYQCHSSQT